MKAVFFDFDGTLTTKSPNIWKAIWRTCGYETTKDSYFTELFTKFIKGQISHQKWCDLTCEKFKDKKFDIYKLKDISKQINLIDGLEYFLKELKSQGYSLHIISGNIKQVIHMVLGNNVKYFDSINANKFEFNEKGNLKKIHGTNYDFEGKAKFIDEYKLKTNSRAEDLYFVGNSDNDEWAYKSGCKTICINPENTDINNSNVWHKVRKNVTNINEILPDIINEFSSKNEKTLI